MPNPHQLLAIKEQDKFAKFLLQTTKQKWELWPIMVALGFWAGIFTAWTWHSAAKTEIYINRANHTQPWEWSRAKNEFDKRHHLFNHAKNWHRIPELDRLQDEMEQVEKADKRASH